MYKNKVIIDRDFINVLNVSIEYALLAEEADTTNQVLKLELLINRSHDKRRCLITCTVHRLKVTSTCTVSMTKSLNFLDGETPAGTQNYNSKVKCSQGTHF